MKTIRHNVFETNSSSTHSIAVPKSCSEVKNITFHVDDFGWGFEEADPADYFYTAIYATSDNEELVNEKLSKLKTILEERGISYKFMPVNTHTNTYLGTEYFYLDNGYIDHGGELGDFVDELLEDGDKCVRFLSEGLVFTGNDNADSEKRGFVERYSKYLETYNWHNKKWENIKNPYYMENHKDYEWYDKGN